MYATKYIMRNNVNFKRQKFTIEIRASQCENMILGICEQPRP